MFFASRLAQANNMRCNLLGTIMGIFLHTCNTPDRVIDVIWRSNSSISAKSINNAIDSLSNAAEVELKKAGRAFKYSYVVDNFDVQLKHKVTTVEQSTDTLFHLTSATLIELVHANPEDLKWSTYLWERSRHNDKRTITPPQRTLFDLVSLHPDPIDTDGLNRRERFNAWKFMVDLCTHGPQYFRKFLPLIEPPESVEKIPPVKTIQIPARSMDLSNATVDGNIDAAEDVLRQGGIDDPEDYVILFHGDLGTYERMKTARKRRSIEETPMRRMQYMLFVPGVFHTEMACADVLYKMFLESTPGRDDETSFQRFIEVLFPNESSKIANGKGSHQSFAECIYKTGLVDRLLCWSEYLQSINPKWDSLKKFADTSPSFDRVKSLSRILGKLYYSTSLKSASVRKTPFKDRDQQFENVLKRVEYFLLFEETIYSIRHGDVGRMETCFIKWIPIFRGTGKHKYAHMLLEFLLDVHFLYPPPLRKIIRYNWLCNPKGTEDGFRGVDWLLELNNLLTKVIYGGRGSNYTVDRILKESILIQLYRDCKKVVEDQFLLTPKTMRHGTPDFTNTYALLVQMANDSSVLKTVYGRKSGYHIPDVFDIGMAKYNTELNSGISAGITIAGTGTEDPVVDIEMETAVDTAKDDSDNEEENTVSEDIDPSYEVDVTETELFDV